MRERYFLLVAVASLLAACSDAPVAPRLTPAEPSPIVNGSPDNGAHPYVGLLVFDDANGPAWRCSGSLLSPTVVLTAGHCTNGAVAARLWIDEVVTGNLQYPFSGTTSYDGTPNTYPGYCIGCAGIGILGFLSGDVGIVVLSEAVPGVSSFVQLPAAGLVGTIKKKASIDLVGYGVQHELVGAFGPPIWFGNIDRFTVSAQFVSGEFFNSGQLLRLTANPAKGKGGLCFGDSGGPDLVGGSDVVLAVNSYVSNNNCTGVTYSTRVDLPGILTWVQGFLP